MLLSASIASISLEWMLELWRRNLYQTAFMFFFTHLCPCCFIPLSHRGVLLSNCHPVSGAEWPCRHRRFHLSSKYIIVNIPYPGISLMFLLCLYYASSIFNQATVCQRSSTPYMCVNQLCIDNDNKLLLDHFIFLFLHCNDHISCGNK